MDYNKIFVYLFHEISVSQSECIYNKEIENIS